MAEGSPAVTQGVPEQSSLARQLLGIGRGEPAWSTAVRSGLAVAAPAAAAVATGHAAQMYLVVSGSFAILFATGAYRTRARLSAEVGAILVASAVGGAALGAATERWSPGAGPTAWAWAVPVLATCLFAALAAVVVTAIRLRAGTATFPVMVFGACQLAPAAGHSLAQVAVWGSAGALAAIVFAVSGYLVDPTGPQRGAVRSAAAAVTAYRTVAAGGTGPGAPDGGGSRLAPSATAAVTKLRHEAIAACHDAWQVLARSGLVQDGRIIARTRRFRGIGAGRLARGSRSRVDLAADGDTSGRYGDTSGRYGDTSGRYGDMSGWYGDDTRYVAALLATQHALSSTILGTPPVYAEAATGRASEGAAGQAAGMAAGQAAGMAAEEVAVVAAALAAHPSTARIPDPPPRYQWWRAVSRASRPTVTGARVLVASILAGGASLALGLGRPDWAIVTVVIVLGMGPTQQSGTVRAVHRLIGTGAGLAVFLGIHVIEPSPWLLVAAIGLCQAMAELTIARNYAIAVIFTTPLALIAGGAIAMDPAAAIGARFLEVAIAVVAAIGCLWLVWPRGTRAIYRSSNRLAHRATGVLITALADHPPADLTSERSVLKFELLGAARSALDAARDDPRWMRAHWPGHEAGQAVASGVLALADNDRPGDIVIPDRLRELRAAWQATRAVP